jgi:crotonobetainyl-CoA:carnitine CoA-transferase CaiB-like acyl-CoA transferase
VIKVESMDGDDTRKWGPPWAEGGESAYFISLNRNKLSITVNMKHPDSKKIIDKLIMRSDVLIENFISGTAEKLGVGYEQVSRMNNRLIYCSVTGFGSTGMYAKRPGYDAICR